MDKDELPPPWIKYPEYPPGDSFWRQSGEAWFQFVCQPYWKSLSPEDQENYLQRWKVPDLWRTYYFDSKFQKWLESVDD